MRNYFGFKLNGKTLFPYFIVAWVLMIISSTWLGVKFMPSTDPLALMDMHYFGSLFGRMAMYLVVAALGFYMLFYIVKFTVGGLSLGEDKFETDYNGKNYAMLCLKGLLLTFITLGIYYPWFITRVVRYFAAGTSFRSNALEFKGQGITLFSYIILLVVLPVILFTFLITTMALVMVGAPALGGLVIAVICVVLMACIAIYEAYVMRWYANFSYGNKRIISKAKVWDFALFLVGQIFLTAITLGLYYPAAMLRIWRYYVGRIVLGEVYVEDKFGFTVNMKSNYWVMLGQYLLVIITFGIYIPWAYAKIANIMLSQAYAEVIEEPSEPMPADY